MQTTDASRLGPHMKDHDLQKTISFVTVIDENGKEDAALKNRYKVFDIPLILYMI